MRVRPKRPSRQSTQRWIVFQLLFCSLWAALSVYTLHTKVSVMLLSDENSSSSGDVRRKDKQLAAVLPAETTYKKHHQTPSTNKDDPYLILHVGPPKTQVNRIQSEFKALSDLLLLDNYTYVDSSTSFLYDSLLNASSSTCGPSEESNTKTKMISDNTRERRSMVDLSCWKAFTDDLSSHQNQSIIISDPSLSFRRDVIDWRTLRRVLHSKNYNLLILVGYRRYYEWLLLTKQQWEQYSTAKRFTADWPGKNSRGQMMQPLFPNYWNVPTQSNLMPFSYTRDVLNDVDGDINMRIINVHDMMKNSDYSSLQTYLLCHVLPTTRNACQKSRQKMMNGRRQNDETASIQDEALSLLQPPHHYYDMLVTRAAELHMISNHQRITRRSAALAAQYYQEQILNLSVYDLPTKCPSRSELQLFLEKSMELERVVLKNAADIQQHQADFWNMVDNKNKNQFCSIDADAVLSNQHWKSFFANRMRPTKVPIFPNKPYLVIHVGPPKTGTTTLQSELTKLSNVLATDNITFAGAFINNTDHTWSGQERIFNLLLTNMTCWKEIEQARVQYEKSVHHTTTLRETLLSIDCLQDIQRELNYYQQRNHSLILSDETLSFRRSMFSNIGRAPLDWIALQEVLQNDWNLRIVVTYRRFYEWLPSAKQQWERYNPLKPSVSQWPHVSNSRGTHVQPLFPTFWKHKLQSNDLPYAFTDYIYDNYWPHVPLIVMNMHDANKNMSIRSKFLCTVLPNAENSCRHSLKRDEKETETIINKSDPPPYYDMLVTRAAERGLLNTTTGNTRRDAALAAEAFQETVLNLTIHDFPTTCPNQTELQAFLEKSLEKEEWLLPEFYKTKYGKEMHERSFHEAVKKGKFCSIDVERVLEKDERWRRFFARDMMGVVVQKAGNE